MDPAEHNLSADIDAQHREAIDAMRRAGITSGRHIARLVHAGCTAKHVEAEVKKVNSYREVKNPAALLVYRLWRRMKLPGTPKTAEPILSVMRQLGLD